MNNSKFRFILCVLILLLVGCQPSAAPAATTVAAMTVSTSNPADTRLTLKPCEVRGFGGNIKAECGALRVPEDRTTPGGRVLDLRIVVVRAQGPNGEPDPLFYIAGGPGDAATNPGITIGVDNILKEVNARRDVIYLDQRGTNDKHKLTCEYPSFQIADASQQQVNDWMKQCLSSLDGDPRFYTTAEAMRDLDEARAALGYDKINLYGISYGVEAEQVYMRMFPEHVRAVVMDHGHPLDLPYAPSRPRATQSALGQVFTYCEQDEKCHAAYPDIRGDWKAVLDRLAKGPVVISWTPPGATTPVQVDKDGIADGKYNLLYLSGTYAQIPFLIHTLATNEDWAPILKRYNEHYGRSGQAEPLLLMKEVITCFEPAPSWQPDEISRLNPGSIFRDLAVKLAQNQQKICAALPKPDPFLIYGPGKPAPLSALMLNSLLDPIFPPTNMDLALKEFTKSRVITEPTEGHNTTFSGCRWDIIAQYIQQGSVDGLDTSCLQNIKPTFVVP
jgi:pimeloyl-ACP methyl ester carboxylesterase